MTALDFANTDPKELARRRQLADARREREDERSALVLRLIEDQARAAQLKGWIRTYETRDATDLTAELKRLLDWARIQYEALEAATGSNHVSKILRDRNLFPDVDKLSDPLGEPSPRQPWGR